MDRAAKAGVVKMGVKGCCESDWLRVIEIYKAGLRTTTPISEDRENYFVRNHFVKIYTSIGLHPWFIADRSPDWFQTLEKLLLEYPQAAVGEIVLLSPVREQVFLRWVRGHMGPVPNGVEVKHFTL